MIFVLGDDFCIDVYESPDEVSGSIEGLNIEDAVLGMCDEYGQRFVAEWSRPNRHGRLFGFLHWSDSGIYRLRPDGSPDRAVLRQLIARAEGLGRPGPFASLDQMRAFIG